MRFDIEKIATAAGPNQRLTLLELEVQRANQLYDMHLRRRAFDEQRKADQKDLDRIETSIHNLLEEIEHGQQELGFGERPEGEVTPRDADEAIQAQAEAPAEPKGDDENLFGD